MLDFEKQHAQAQWCRKRAESHRRQAAALAYGDPKRRFHEKECTSWIQEAMFYEAMRNSLIGRRLAAVA